uniref:Uncharacterized protein n=1 Tax=Rhipicephalus appendiculatus TaxID=34631 RepID=A0A131YAU7_RHIAP
MESYPMVPPSATVSSSSAQGSFNEMPPSLNDPPSYSSASKDDETVGGPRVAAMVIGVMILLAIILMAVMVIALASGWRSNDKTTWNDERPDITEQNVRGGGAMTVIIPEFRFPSSPPPVTTKSTPQASTTKKVTEETTEEDTTTPFNDVTIPVDTRSTTTELPTTRAKKDTWAGLLCTIGTKLSVPEILPDDRWCNYLFYDSVYKNGPEPFDPSHLDPTLSIFMDHLSKYNATALGIGFAYKYTQHLNSELSQNDSDTPVVLKHFFDENICSFAILDTPSDGLDKSTLEEMLESLKLVDGFVRSKESWPRKCLTVVAVPTPDTSLEDVYIEVFPKIFTPSVVVILSHYVQGDNTFQDCRVVPPIMLTRPDMLTSSSNYKFDMNSGAQSIEKLIARGMDAIWALSVTLKGRWTKLKAGEPVGFLSQCEHDPSAESFGRYSDACMDPSLSNGTHYKSGLQGTMYFSSDGRILSFDNNTDIVQKLCRLRNQHLTFAYGIAAYDVDYEDYSDACESVSVLGPFTRVFTLTLLRDYVRVVFDIPREYEDCLKLDY